MTDASISKQVTIGSCHSRDDLKLCVDLQRRIWRYDDEDVVPASIFVVAQHGGGQSYCAFHDHHAVGFEPAFSVQRHGCGFWHSHTIFAQQTPSLGYEIRERCIRELTVRHESCSARAESVAVLK